MGACNEKIIINGMVIPINVGAKKLIEETIAPFMNGAYPQNDSNSVEQVQKSSEEDKKKVEKLLSGGDDGSGEDNIKPTPEKAMTSGTGTEIGDDSDSGE